MQRPLDLHLATVLEKRDDVGLPNSPSDAGALHPLQVDAML